MTKFTKIDQVFNLIKQQIDQKKLTEGTRLSSVRLMAKELGFSVSTIVEAYARLQAENLIESRTGSGYFVVKQNVQTFMPELDQVFVYDREVDPLWISRQSLENQIGVLKPGCGWLPSDWLPEQSIRKSLKQIAKLEHLVLTDYATPQGHKALRQLIAKRKESFEIYVNSTNVLLVDSATQAIDLIFRQSLSAGDVIIIDDPCYFNFQALIKAHKLQTIAIPFTENGPDIDKFEQALHYKPKFYLTNSAIHNPTGATLSLHTAFKIAQLCEQNEITIIEDDIFADFEEHAAPRYAALSGIENVIQIGSFSKTISSSFRIGYIITNQSNIDQLIDLKIATNFTNNQLNSEIVFHVLMDPTYLKHLDWMKKRLNFLRNDTIKKLESLSIIPWTIPKSGLFLWCKLPDHIDASALSKQCIKEGIILAPGNAFSQSKTAHQFMRFNVAQCQDKKVWDVLTQAIEQLKAK